MHVENSKNLGSRCAWPVRKKYISTPAFEDLPPPQTPHGPSRCQWCEVGDLETPLSTCITCDLVSCVRFQKFYECLRCMATDCESCCRPHGCMRKWGQSQSNLSLVKLFEFCTAICRTTCVSICCNTWGNCECQLAFFIIYHLIENLIELVKALPNNPS